MVVSLLWGSSPLSRGILPECGGHCWPQRIIPALAGNTSGVMRSTARSADHPRSRGEYKACTALARRSQGSSPLSRGIPLIHRFLLLWLGIIPALAGNTTHGHALFQGRRDHPRSRGEYRVHNQSASKEAGSSPLSRGILAVGMCGFECVGIIPALAGNTRCSTTRPPSGRDHPRSRGEYPDPRTGISKYSGSSPLSRGIRHRRHYQPHTSRIIPALAGNTVWRPPPAMQTTDHPRSRGEYRDGHFSHQARKGSSPLSRGIPGVEIRHNRADRIIPALAGNTGS